MGRYISRETIEVRNGYTIELVEETLETSQRQRLRLFSYRLLDSQGRVIQDQIGSLEGVQQAAYSEQPAQELP